MSRGASEEHAGKEKTAGTKTCRSLEKVRQVPRVAGSALLGVCTVHDDLTHVNNIESINSSVETDCVHLNHRVGRRGGAVRVSQKEMEESLEFVFLCIFSLFLRP